MRVVVAGLFLVLSAPAVAGYGDGVKSVLNRDLLSCETNSSFLRSNCSVSTKTFLPLASFKDHRGKTQKVGVKVRVDYAFACEGHPMEVGVASEQESEEMKFKGTKLSLEGYGPFQVKSFSPGRNGATYKAAISAGCQLKIRRVHWDLNGTSQKRLTQWISTTKDLVAGLSLVEKTQATLGALQSTLAALDVAGIQAALGAVKTEAQSLLNRAEDEATQDALTDAVDEIDVLVALNPASVTGAQMKERAGGVFAVLSKQSAEVARGLKALKQGLGEDLNRALGFASSSTTKAYRKKLAAAVSTEE